MAIKFRCPKCRQKYSVELKHAGRKIRCEKCSTKMRVPEAGSDADAADEEWALEKTSGATPGQADTGEGPDQDETSKPVEKPPELQAALKNLLDEDDDDVVEGISEEAPEAAVDFAESSPEKGSERPAKQAQSSSPQDDLAAVMEFEEALEDDSPKAVAAPLPDELFADDEDEEEEDFFGGGRGGEDEEMDLTPMVDVTFLLLIFFMITASFSIQKSLEVPPPNPEEKGQSQSIQNLEEMEEESIMVDIDARNLVMVDEELVSNLDLLPKIFQGKGKAEILITAHEDSLHEVVVRVIDASNEAKLQKIRVGVKKGYD